MNQTFTFLIFFFLLNSSLQYQKNWDRSPKKANPITHFKYTDEHVI